MRLIDTKTKRLVDKVGPPPRYAILSHTWDDEEVSFQDVVFGHVKSRKGYPKFNGAIKLAASQGYEFIWIDNCCIDKSSSAELSEAINSMFQWYRQATVCYVYFNDVSADTGGQRSFEASCAQELRYARWFRRSWTLQELIAPRQLEFYSRDWLSMGNKLDHRWQDILPTLTRISHYALFNTDGYKYASVAQKMSWAAKREATREEDVAYALFGLFGVHMAPLYGEGGRNAFYRLQEEIIRKGPDDTICAWDPLAYSTILPDHEQSGLAPSPSCFREKGDVIYTLTNSTFEADSIHVTPKGLMMEVPIIKTTGMRGVIAVLSSKRVSTKVNLLGISLLPLDKHNDDRSWSKTFYTRDHTRDVVRIDPSTMRDLERRRIYIVPGNSILATEQQQAPTSRRIWLRSLPHGFTVIDSYPYNLWDAKRQEFRGDAESLLHPRRRLLLLQHSEHDRSRFYLIVLTTQCDRECITTEIILRAFLTSAQAEETIYIHLRDLDPVRPAGFLDSSSCTFSHYPDATWSNARASSFASVSTDWPVVAEVQPEQRGEDLGFGLRVYFNVELHGQPREILPVPEDSLANWMDVFDSLS